MEVSTGKNGGKYGDEMEACADSGACRTLPVISTVW